MKKVYIIASGTTAWEEVTECIVDNNHKNIDSALKQLFTPDDTHYLHFLGVYTGYELGTPAKDGIIPLKVKCINKFDHEQILEWELRPVKLYI